MKRGEIFLLPFPFTDLKGRKLRPAVVVSSDTYNTVGKDVLFVYITHKGYTTPYDIRLETSNPDFKGTGLKVPSTIRAGKVACLDGSISKGYLGKLGPDTLKRIDHALATALSL